MTRHLPSLLAAALLWGCPQQEPEIPAPPPTPASDPTFCEEACSAWAKLGCEEGEDLYNSDLEGEPGVPNQSCTEWCQEMQDRQSALNPKCTRLVDSCDQIEDYRLKDPEKDCEGI